ncbi:plasma membrane fusion protein prm1 [Terramyces sp. JEL0728]|nr:plasma membrane fusion protein prm1 [Terramyces sp. JEL0728]
MVQSVFESMRDRQAGSNQVLDDILNQLFQEASAKQEFETDDVEYERLKREKKWAEIRAQDSEEEWDPFYESTTNTLASTPRYVAISINRQTTKMIQVSEKHATQSVQFTMALAKNILLYILFRYQKTLECLVTLSLQASLQEVSANSKEITDFVNQQLTGMLSSLESSLNTLDSELSSIKSGLNSMAFGHAPSFNIPIPFTIPGVSDNLHWSLPASTANLLGSLGAAPVSLDSIHEKVSDLISAPFDTLTNNVNTKISSVISKSNLSDPHAFDFLPLPDQITSIRFCDQMLDMAFIDRLTEALTVGIVVGIFILLVGMLLTLVTYTAINIYNHHLERKKLQYLERNLTGTKSLFENPDPEEVYYYVKSDLFMNCLLDYRIFDRLSGSWKTRAVWFIDYVNHPIAWICIIVGLLGFTAMHLQTILVPWIFSLIFPTVKTELENSVHGIENIAQAAVNATVGPYVNAINSALDGIETDMNTILFGFIDSTISEIDSSVTTVFSSFESAIQDTLKPIPILDQAIGDFYSCLLGNTTFVIKEMANDLKDGIQIVIPRVTQDLFGYDSSSMMDSLDLIGKVGGIEGDLKQGSVLFEGYLHDLISVYKQTLWMQSIPFLLLFVTGFSLIVFGLVAVVYDMFR